MSNFVSRIQWSSDKFSLNKVVELFPLPQVVKVQKGSSRDSLRNEDINDEILVLHSVRTIKIIRATDFLKNEFFVSCDSTARVEVIWKDYKRFYENVEELSVDFPAHVLVVGDDRFFGIQKGDILKLKQKLTSRDIKYLQCAVVNRVCDDINIPFGYKGLFKTLGDFHQDHVLLSDVMQHCKLPVVVKFIDSELKMKRADGSSRFPIALCNLENVTLHEVVNYCDIVANKSLTDNRVCLISIPLDGQDVDVNVPTAATRSDESYTQFCATIVQKTSSEALRKVAMQLSHWIVFQDDDEPTSQNQPRYSRSSSVPSFAVSSLIFHQEEEDNGCNIPGASLHSSTVNVKANIDSPPVPSEPIYSQVIRVRRKTPSGEPTAPPIPPKQFNYTSIPPGLIRTHQGAQGRRFSEPAVQVFSKEKRLTRKSSISFPRSPNLSENSADTSFKIYESIWIGKISQDGDQEDEVMPIILNKFGGSEHLDAEDGYVTMKPNVMTHESIYEELENVKTNFPSYSGANSIPVHPNTKTTEKQSFEKAADGDGQKLGRPPIPPPYHSANYENRDKSESKIKVQHKPYEEVPSLKINADRRNDLQGDKKTKTPSKLEFLNKDIRNWSEKDVAKFLKNINLDQYIKTFKEKKVDGKVLESLNEDSLSKDMKITNRSHVMRLMRFTGECIKHEKIAVQNIYHPS